MNSPYMWLYFWTYYSFDTCVCVCVCVCVCPFVNTVLCLDCYIFIVSPEIRYSEFSKLPSPLTGFRELKFSIKA